MSKKKNYANMSQSDPETTEEVENTEEVVTDEQVNADEVNDAKEVDNPETADDTGTVNVDPDEGLTPTQKALKRVAQNAEIAQATSAPMTDEELEDSSKPYVTNCKALNLRARPGFAARVVTVLLPGDIVELVNDEVVTCQSEYEWVTVKNKDGRVGFVCVNYLGNLTLGE